MRRSIDDFLRNRRRGPDGEKILRQADGLKINLYRRSNGEISGTFEIEGNFGPSLMRCNDDDGDNFNATPDPYEQTEAQGLEFMRGLLAAFERERPRGGDGGEGRGGDDGGGDDGGSKIRAK